MKITKSQLKQIIKEEMESAVQEQKDPKKLDAAARAMILASKLDAHLSLLKGGGRPPEMTIEGVEFVEYVVGKSGYSYEEIQKYAQNKK